MSLPWISRHLKVLERAGLIMKGRDGAVAPCRFATGPLAEADGWIAPVSRGSSSSGFSRGREQRLANDERRPHDR